MDTLKKVGVLMIRGSGHSDFKRQELFISRLNRILAQAGLDPDLLAHATVDWYSPLQRQQELVLLRMKKAKVRLRSNLTRKLIITNIGDLINYGGKPGLPHFGYQQTHELVHQTILNLKKQLNDHAPLLIIATSMGTEIINDYIRDRQTANKEGKADPLGNSPFERFETLTGLFTLGNNLPIFAASQQLDEIQPIDFPSPLLSPELQSIAVWENYYDKNDAMGYPIKPLNKHFEKNPKLNDIQINIGGVLTFWNTFSHFGYWRSRRLVRRLASYIEELLSFEENMQID
jgi:hypothetical protein